MYPYPSESTSAPFPNPPPPGTGTRPHRRGHIACSNCRKRKIKASSFEPLLQRFIVTRVYSVLPKIDIHDLRANGARKKGSHANTFPLPTVLLHTKTDRSGLTLSFLNHTVGSRVPIQTFDHPKNLTPTHRRKMSVTEAPDPLTNMPALLKRLIFLGVQMKMAMNRCSICGARKLGNTHHRQFLPILLKAFRTFPRTNRFTMGRFRAPPTPYTRGRAGESQNLKQRVKHRLKLWQMMRRACI